MILRWRTGSIPQRTPSTGRSTNCRWLSATAFFEDDDHLILPSLRQEDGEERFKVIGSVDGKLYTGVFVWRDDLPRFISVRRSNKGEDRAYRSSP